jgi:CRP/FNR family transcriptional regulator, cyclic AMP receptor protein
MPSARQIELDQPPGGQTADLYSLVREIHGANVHNLNSLHGRGSILFAEGEPARGVYILRTGRATLSISSSEGRIVMLRMAQAGDVLGLNAVLRNGSYEVTMKTLEPCRTDFISRVELIALMQKSQAGVQAIVKLLSHELTELTDRTKLLLLPQTASGRLAKLLLHWSNGNGSVNRIFTHEEIAQMICSSRETVTRLLAILNRQQAIRVTSNSILILDRGALEKLST